MEYLTLTTHDRFEVVRDFLKNKEHEHLRASLSGLAGDKERAEALEPEIEALQAQYNELREDKKAAKA